MSLQDAVELGTSILVSLGGGSAIVYRLSNHLGRVWADRALEKEKHKYAELLQAAKGELDKATNRYQVALDALGHVHKLRITEEFSRLGQLWKYLAILQEASNIMCKTTEWLIDMESDRTRKNADNKAEEFEVALTNAYNFFLQESYLSRWALQIVRGLRLGLLSLREIEGSRSLNSFRQTRSMKDSKHCLIYATYLRLA